ncbi:hypothetical protein BRADI_1g19090v3 [Brachypodium distachyon]|uniref:Uncharacterized protein n=1 Tax=Brachypodium distachyon TaxID=15368 RepID=A0A2K2DK27_BRADI|nr:hypothetical protein BRADI_1g19090v3 [Brachypodium distachyon]
MELQELSVSGTNKRHGVDEQRSVGRSWAWAAECISSIGLQENALFGPNARTSCSSVHAGCKRPLELTVYDPAAAAEAQQRANAAALPGPLVPYLAPPSSSSSLSEPINAVPLAAFAPDSRVEPWWVRGKLFPHLKLRFELPVHFIAEKTVTATDLDPHQNRFRLPTDGVLRNLRPILSPIELAAANLLHDEAPRPRPPRQLVVPEDQNQEGMRKKKRKGKKHGGLPVLVVGYDAGIRELQMSRWESSRGVIIKGEGYLGFIADCSFKVGDAVEIWAFRERFFRLFGSNVCADSPLHVLITKKG